MSNHHVHAGFFGGTSAVGVWNLGAELLRHGPSWDVLPPLFLAIGSLVLAWKSWLDGAQERRHREEEHRARLGCVLHVAPPGVERLN